ncbi:HAD family hydrolase [Cytophaga aurantiaca]|uniref:HAD family hydrolase n=1 Tax=Cytophaga aurantiaca TaxID=29530 RepID=UPI0012FA23FA|nr:HAD family hydrolase [Cytophaga aurantiaca]
MKKFFIYLVLAASINACTTKDNAHLNKAEDVEAKDQMALSSWSDSTRQLIEAWVKDVTDTSSPNFIPVPDRIAVFDNDGTLWPEQPVPNQLIFAIANLKALAPTHPEFQKDQVLKGILDGDLSPMKKAGEIGFLKLLAASHTNQTEDAFNLAVRNWADTARDAKFHKLYKEVIYLPMVELLNYLRANEFKTFIVSGGGVDFMRVWTEEAYGIPPYQVIGSYAAVKYDVVDGKPVITKTAGSPYVDDKAGKPQAIHQFIGKVPVFCGGNSDGDQAMMQYTSGSKYKSMCVILHHTDATREYEYDLKTLSGHLETALVEAKEKNWLVVDMKKDFKRIFSFD